MAEVSGHHVELVGTGLQLSFFLNERTGGAEPVKAISGRAMALQGSITATIALTPQAPNKLAGELPRPLGPGDRILVMATLADGHAIQARFVRN